MEKSSKNLKEKVLLLMCLGALAGNMGTEVYATDDYVHYEIKCNDSEVEIDDEINISNENPKIGLLVSEETGEGIRGFDSKITFNNKVKIDKNDSSKSIWVNPIIWYSSTTAKFNNDLYIKNTSVDGYALYCGCEKSSAILATASIIVGDGNSNSKIQIIGNLGVKTESYTSGAKSTIELNLNNKDSFFAGKMLSEKLSSSNTKKGEEKITLNLKDGATWYAHDSNGKDSYNISGEVKDDLNGNLKTLITSNGGVIDIYHTAPDESPLLPTSEQLNQLKELEIMAKKEFVSLEEQYTSNEISEEKYEERKKQIEGELIIGKEYILDGAIERGTRTFTLNGVGDRLQNTTFRISTNVENKKADKIVLNDVEVKKDSETYFIEIAADPFKSGEWKADKDDKILVMDINGKDLDKITVEGKEYEAEIGAGLVKQKIIPTVEEDTANKGDWYLTSIDKIESKGSGHIFAEIGAAANVGMASAWRTDSGDLYQRMGNLRNNEAEQGVWGRIYTGENEVRKGIGLDLEYRAVQVGYDRKENIDGGKLFTGIAFGYFDGNADYDHGSGESNSATVGMYATYSGNNGSFGDFIVKLGNIDNKLSYTSESGDYYKADYDTYGFSADAEYGYRYEFDNDYYIEPLAQLSYIYIADEEYTMNLNGESGAKVSNDDYQSLIGYAGFHYGKKFGDNVAYLRVAAAHEFAGDIDVDARYQDIKVNSSISGEDTWVEYGVGFDVKVKEDTAVYGRLQKSTGDIVKNKWHASVGLRYTF